MLAVDILTLFWLASCAAAFPQKLPIANTSSASISTASTETWVHLEPTTSGFEGLEDPPTTATGTPWIIIIESSVTGWETTNRLPTTSPQVIPRPQQTPEVVVTKTPTIIGIHTDISQPPRTSFLGHDPGQGRPNQANTDAFGGEPQTSPMAPAAPVNTPTEELLSDIISRIKPRPQPTAPTVAASASPGPTLDPQLTTGFENTDPPGTLDAAPTATVGALITLGPATLTLTPGLSTTLGTGTTAAFVGIATNTAGQTIITVSSSGTAITATVTDVPVTVTKPLTGFDASITDFVSPPEASSSGESNVASTISEFNAVVSTASKGGVVSRDESGLLVAILVGIVGMGAAL